MRPKNNHKIIQSLIVLFILTTTIFQTNTLKADSVNTILVTEIGAHEKSDNEWIEIFNPNNEEVNLEGLIFHENNTNHSTTILSENTTIQPNSFGLIVNKFESFSEKYPNIDLNNILVIDSSWQSLSLNGETLSFILNEKIIEEITYPELIEEKSLQRVYQENSFLSEWSAGIQENSILQASSHHDDETHEQKNNTQCEEPIEIIKYETNTIETKLPFIAISEVSIQDENKDWIELYINTYDQEVNLEDIGIIIDGKNKFEDTNTVNKNGYITVETDLTGTTEQIVLEYKNEPIDSLCWSNSNPTSSEQTDIQNLLETKLWNESCFESERIEKNQTLIRTNFLNDIASINNWTLSPTPTKGSSNQIINNPPTAKIEIQSGKTTGEVPLKINLTGQNSSDPDNDKLNYKWIFENNSEFEGENPNVVTFNDPGTYEVTLIVNDPFGLKSTAHLQIEAQPQEAKSTDNTKNATTEITKTESIPPETTINSDYNIRIAAFFPNPEGKDEDKEWIEIINLSETTANLDKWKLDDADGQSKEYSLSNISLKPNEKYKIYDSDSGITLNNSQDEIRIIKPDQSIQHAISYSNAQDNEIFKTDNNEWTRFIENSQPNTSTAFYEQMPGDDPTQDPINNVASTNKGDLNSKLQFTEIFPNPKGKDENKEWIEIFNPKPVDTSLKNWKIKINNTEHILESEIAYQNSYTQIFTTFSLPNTSASIELYDPQNNLIDSFKYTETEEEKSYATLDDFIGSPWNWTPYTTPGSENPHFIEIEGTISSIDNNNQTITLNGKTIIYKNEDNSELFKTGAFISLDAVKYNDTLEIDQIFEISDDSMNKDNKRKLDPVIYTIPFILVSTFVYRKKLKNLISKYF